MPVSSRLRQAITYTWVTVLNSAGARTAGKGDELVDSDLTDAAGFRIGEVGEPFELGRNLGEVAALGRVSARWSAGAVLVTRTGTVS
jgi:hypothetical protein